MTAHVAAAATIVWTRWGMARIPCRRCYVNKSASARFHRCRSRMSRSLTLIEAAPPVIAWAHGDAFVRSEQTPKQRPQLHARRSCGHDRRLQASGAASLRAMKALSMTGASRRRAAASSRRPSGTCSPVSEMPYCPVAWLNGREVIGSGNAPRRRRRRTHGQGRSWR
jgi:hypothetical protein